MTTTRQVSDEPSISQTDLDRVLERALQLDAARASELTLSRVREISAELGISPEAVEQAFAEHILSEQGRRALAVVERNEMRKLKKRLLTSAVLFAVFASTVTFVEAGYGIGDEEMLPAILAILGIAIPIALAYTIRVRLRGASDEPGAAEEAGSA